MCNTATMAETTDLSSRFEDPLDFEHVLLLPRARQLHYASAGNPDASTVIVFFAGCVNP
jgi:hypothetical protein